jgi:hypothetical protein
VGAERNDVGDYALTKTPPVPVRQFTRVNFLESKKADAEMQRFCETAPSKLKSQPSENTPDACTTAHVFPAGARVGRVQTAVHKWVVTLRLKPQTQMQQIQRA